MAFTDQQIADYAHQLEAKGASYGEIETFVKSAKQEQTAQAKPEQVSKPAVATESSPIAGAVKGLVGAMNPANFVQNAVEGVKKTAEAAKNLGVKVDVTPAESEERNQNVSYLNSKGMVPEAQRSDEEIQNAAGNMKVMSGDAFNSLLPNIAGKAVSGVGDVASGLADAGKGFVDEASNIASGNEHPEVAGATMRGLTKSAVGVGNILSSPVTGSLESLPETSNIKSTAENLLSMPNSAAVKLFKSIRPDLDETYIQDNIVNPIWGALSVEGGMKMAGETGPITATTGKIKKGINTIGKKLADVKTGFMDNASALATKLDPETIKTIKANPETALKAMKEQTPETARQSVFNELKNHVDTNLKNLKDSGKSYGQFRQNTSVKLNDGGGNFLEKKITAAGLEITDTGKIKATSESSIRSPGDLNKIQSLYDMYGKKNVMSGNEYLNLRSDLSELAKYNQETTPGIRLWSKNTRKGLNNFRNQIKGLEEADLTHTSLNKELKGIKEVVYDKTGEIRPDAISRVNDLLNKGKEGKASLLEQTMPKFQEFKSKIRIAKMLEDIEKSQGQKVGAYAGSALQGGANLLTGSSLMTGNIPLAAASAATKLIFTPKIFSKLLAQYSKTANIPSEMISSIQTKVNRGVKLTPSQQNVVKGMLMASPSSESKQQQ